MKTFKFALVAFLFTTTFGTFAQTGTGKVYLIRSTGFAGSAVNYWFYIDGTLTCKTKNKLFSIHDLSAGEHTVSIVAGGLRTAKKSPPVKITVVAGKTNYVSVVSTERGYSNKIACQEITENSAQPLLAKAKEKKDCLASK